MHISSLNQRAVCSTIISTTLSFSTTQTSAECQRQCNVLAVTV